MMVAIEVKERTSGGEWAKIKRKKMFWLNIEIFAHFLKLYVTPKKTKNVHFFRFNVC
jgi:hypothetical protein